MTIRYNTQTIEMTKKFAKAAEKFGSEEYKSLQEARRDNPAFKVVVVARKVAEKKDAYKGLTYEYMEKYINAHDDAAIKVLTDTDAASEMQTVCVQKWIEPGIGSGIRWCSTDLIEPQRQPQKPFSKIKSQLRGSFGQIYPLLGK